MKSREFKKIYHPSLGRYVYEHRGNGLIVDNIMKPLKAALSAAASKADSTVAKKIGRKASKKLKGAEKSGDLIRKRLTQERGLTSESGRTPKAKMSQNEVNTLINNLIARS